ncbi:hypothetical protein NQT62_08640 [Limnobacter humi]|uniref:Uncharacterized protein n=1 Tax=Limnobacter humi TaxID=1778671 RepID=A0ABT1WIE5_9BURK|nr:hypothetical protein [Limnobacter humi]MCQ8896497.1 hypothetical protein [Limnobacter humi]
MNRLIYIGCIALLSVSSAVAQEFKKMDSQYMLYSGSLGDPVKPTKKDTKISIEISNQAAEDIFNQLGSDLKDVCLQDPGSRYRMKSDGSIACTYTQQDGYICYIGIDLKKGKLIPGSIC